MSRIWTAISIAGNCVERHEFSASYDPQRAEDCFRDDNPGKALVALMPGIRRECMTYNIKPAGTTPAATVDPFSMDGLSS